jgi:GDPmannose 4,6-dehydratase
MLQQDEPEDYVIATGNQYSVRQFAEAAFAQTGIDIDWQGEGAGEQGVDGKTGRALVEVDRRYYRPAEVRTLLGDATKARERLGWEPEVSFEDLVSEMVREDLKLAERDSLCKREGYRVYEYRE